MSDKVMRALVFLFLAPLCLPLAAEDGESPAIKILSFSFSSMVMADTSLTYDALAFHGCRESNGFWRPLMDRPGLVLGLDLAICTGVTLGVHWLYRRNKALAWVVIVGLNAVQGYMMYRQWKVRH